MIFREQNNLTFVVSPMLAVYPELIHGFSTRLGGASTGPFASLNLSRSVGDDPVSVRENRRRWFGAFGLHEEDVYTPHQVLGSEIHAGPPFSEVPADGAITATAGQALLTQSADCVLILLYDPGRRVVGNLHASWRGTLAEIAPKGITRMREQFGSVPHEVRAAIGPSIGPCCYEVRDDVISQFREKHRYFGEYLHRRKEKSYLDLWGLNRRQLMDAGVTENHMDLASLCTRCHPEWFYSHRRDPSGTGRFGAVIALK